MKAPQGALAEGFTLIELMVVTTVIGVLASIAVPKMLGSRILANETAVIAAMRAIATAEAQFVSTNQLDQDGDGMGEYGTLGELGALDPLRGSAAPIARNLLSASVATVIPSGWAAHHGYYFALYLPDATGAGVLAVPANAAAIAVRQSELHWTCLAWPVSNAPSGSRVFFVNGQGLLLQARGTSYSGTTVVPPPGAALIGADPMHIDYTGLAANTVGADGYMWRAVQ